jgi:hypothetical protein
MFTYSWVIDMILAQKIVVAAITNLYWNEFILE